MRVLQRANEVNKQFNDVHDSIFRYTPPSRAYISTSGSWICVVSGASCLIEEDGMIIDCSRSQTIVIPKKDHITGQWGNEQLYRNPERHRTQAEEINRTLKFTDSFLGVIIVFNTLCAEYGCGRRLNA